MKTMLLAAIALAFNVQSATAAKLVGTLTQVDGNVKIFSHPGKKISGPKPHALYEGEYYSVKNATIGDRLEKGNIIRTAPGAKARVVYDNGDQFNVASATAYRIKWRNGKTTLALRYGKIRGMISKKGPRKGLRVKTRTATMGVRGTEFFVADNGKVGGTEVTVMRGKVEVTPEPPKTKSKTAKVKKPKPITVETGFSAKVEAPPKPKKEETRTVAKTSKKTPEPKKIEPVIELKKTTQQQLVSIDKASVIKQKPKTEAQKKKIKPEVAAKLEKLEKKAVETTLTDIKEEDPKLYASLTSTKDKITSVTQIQKKVVKKLKKTAPKAPPSSKPTLTELENLGGGGYENFKIVD